MRVVMSSRTQESARARAFSSTRAGLRALDRCLNMLTAQAGVGSSDVARVLGPSGRESQVKLLVLTFQATSPSRLA
jgi:hypothetical protein